MSDNVQSSLPYSWKILHVSLCLIGVNNVFFIKSLSTLLRLATLVYHAAFLCLSIPVLFLYVYNMESDTSVDSLVEQGTHILLTSSVLLLGIVYMINTLKANRAVKFIGTWHLVSSDKTIYNGNVENMRFKIARSSFVLNTICQLILCVIFTARAG